MIEYYVTEQGPGPVRPPSDDPGDETRLGWKLESMQPGCRGVRRVTRAGDRPSTMLLLWMRETPARDEWPSPPSRDEMEDLINGRAFRCRNCRKVVAKAHEYYSVNLGPSVCPACINAIPMPSDGDANA